MIYCTFFFFFFFFFWIAIASLRILISFKDWPKWPLQALFSIGQNFYISHIHWQFNNYTEYIALFLNLAFFGGGRVTLFFCYSLQICIVFSIFDLKYGFCLNFNILWIFFDCSLNFKEVSRFDSGVFCFTQKKKIMFYDL